MFVVLRSDRPISPPTNVFRDINIIPHSASIAGQLQIYSRPKAKRRLTNVDRAIEHIGGPDEYRKSSPIVL
jgi:hypothetical protein